MIDRKHIELMLQANGIKPTADDEQIRSVLISAKWNDNDVDTALSVLKENVVSLETHIDTLHKVFRTDEALSAQEISGLLGIDVDLPQKQRQYERTPTASNFQHVFILVATVIVAFVSLGYVMYSQKIGPFHEAQADYTIESIAR